MTRRLLVVVSVALAVGVESAGARALPNPCKLLTPAQVSKLVGGKVATAVFSKAYGEPTCTWSSPPLGLYHDRQTFSVSVFRATKAELKQIARKSIPPSIPLNGVGAPAYRGGGASGGFEAWKHGTIVDVEGTLVTVFPQDAITVLRRALAQL